MMSKVVVTLWKFAAGGNCGHSKAGVLDRVG